MLFKIITRCIKDVLNFFDVPQKFVLPSFVYPSLKKDSCTSCENYQTGNKNCSMAIGWGLPSLYIKKTFWMGLFYCFWNNFRWILSNNCYSDVVNGSKSIKYCEFFVEILYCDCRKLAKNVWFWWNIVYQFFWNKYLLTKNIWYYKIIFSLTTLMFSLMLFVMSAKYRVNLNIFYSTFV